MEGVELLDQSKSARGLKGSSSYRVGYGVEEELENKGTNKVKLLKLSEQGMVDMVHKSKCIHNIY